MTYNIGKHSAWTEEAYDASEHTGFQRLTTVTGSAPSVNNDSADTAVFGHTFAAGDLWINTSGIPACYRCESAGVGAAVWRGIAYGGDHATQINRAFDTAAHTGFQRLTTVVAAAPSVNNDAVDTASFGHTFAAGDIWNNVTTGKLYICEDATATAAVWTLQGPVVSTEVALAAFTGSVQAAADLAGGGVFDPSNYANSGRTRTITFRALLSTSDVLFAANVQLYSLTDATQICSLSTSSLNPVELSQALTIGAVGLNQIPNLAKHYEVRVWVTAGTGVETVVLQKAHFDVQFT